MQNHAELQIVRNFCPLDVDILNSITQFLIILFSMRFYK
jgi:hypothetical protein